MKANLASDAIKAGISGIVEGVKQIGKFVGQAVSNYAQYEQLVGGVETLFKDSASIVTAYAENAYKSAGLSANAYMETVTAFSASLIQSLGGDTEAAAKYADLAITDMSDNANKMGSDIVSIQNAYQGFAKQNYTMLDNLKLGYGGTKEEMERLLADAEAIAGVEFDISSYADVVQAIHVIQEEMGIAGATAAEASITISGSFNALKAAWDNLVTGLATGEDLGGLINNVVESAATAVGNVMPVISQVLIGAGALIEGLAPIIGEQLPAIISGTLPSLISAGGTLLLGVINGIVKAAPSLMSAALDAVMTLAQGLIEALPELMPAAVQMISDLALMLTDPGNLSLILSAALQLIVSLAEGLMTAIPQLVQAAIQVVNGIVTFLLEPGNIAMLINAALRIVIAIGAGLISAIPELLTSGVELIQSLIDQFGETDWGEVGSKLVDGILGGLKSAWESLKNWAVNAWNKFVGIFRFPDNHDYNMQNPTVPTGGSNPPTGGGSSSSSSSSLPTARASANAAASAQGISGLTGAVLATGQNGGNYEIVVKLSDDTELARALFSPMQLVATQRGEAIA